eukprot:1705467-Amphidinium_carterae.1
MSVRSHAGWSLPENPCHQLRARKPSQGKKYAKLAYKPKSRIVVRGNFQSYTFHDTHTSNTDASLLRLILSLYAAESSCISTMDISAAFLNVNWIQSTSLSSDLGE